MVVLGLILVVVGALAILGAFFTAEGSTELLGSDISALAMFLIGLASGVAIWWGFTIGKFGTKRNLRRRRETKQLNELSEKLEKRKPDHRDDRPDEVRHDPGSGEGRSI